MTTVCNNQARELARAARVAELFDTEERFVRAAAPPARVVPLRRHSAKDAFPTASTRALGIGPVGGRSLVEIDTADGRQLSGNSNASGERVYIRFGWRPDDGAGGWPETITITAARIVGLAR